MDTSELVALESELGIILPADYKATMVRYPFSGDHVGIDMLSNDSKLLREWNSSTSTSNKMKKMMPSLSAGYFMIGSDGSETGFYIATGDHSLIFYHDVETGKLALYAQSIDEYLQRCEKIDFGEEAYPNESTEIAEWMKWVYMIAIPTGFLLLGWGVFRGASWLIARFINR
jgi:hypothetical protein